MLAHPASVDNLPTSAGKEDHVSMGMTAALKLRTIVENAEVSRSRLNCSRLAKAWSFAGH